MISLVYASSAVNLMTNRALDELLETSRENNKRLDITGMLLYKDGNFMQALEGPDENVLTLYQKIERDPRHTGSIKLLQRKIEEREFGDWAMAFCDFNRTAEDSPDGRILLVAFNIADESAKFEAARLENEKRVKLKEEWLNSIPVDIEELRAGYALMRRLLNRARRIELEATEKGRQNPILTAGWDYHFDKRIEKYWSLEAAEIEESSFQNTYNVIDWAFEHLEEIEAGNI